MRQLHWEGWTALDGGMPEWDLRSFVERLHRRYHGRIVSLLERWRKDWMKPDRKDTGPGASRPGGLVARRVSEELKDTGIFVYAAHPSQADDADDDKCSGPRWYVTCTEAVMKHYDGPGMAPLPPLELQDLLWPFDRDRTQPWLTELGWTEVPENSEPQIMHADICSSSAPEPRKAGRGRYHHFVWKTNPDEVCTTNIVPGAFTEGCAEWEHYDKWTVAKARALIFDSEMLHRGGRTAPGVGWTTSLTLQVCSGSGWSALQERVGANLMWYTQPLGWQEGDAVDVFVEKGWHRAIVTRRGKNRSYSVVLSACNTCLKNVSDCKIRYRQAPEGMLKADLSSAFPVGSRVEALSEDTWHAAKVVRRNADGTYRVVWRGDKSFTDAVMGSHLRASTDSGKSNTPSESSSTRTSSRTRGRSNSGERTDRTAVKRRKVCAAKGRELFSRGFVQLEDGLPREWRDWPIFDFLEVCFDVYNDLVVRELELLRDFWVPCKGSEQRHGAFAAAKVSERLEPFGIAIYSPAPSMSESQPYQPTGPRWYVSVTSAAMRYWKEAAPAAPPAVLEAVGVHASERGGLLQARGLGWALAPGSSNPQALHADIWGVGAFKRPGDRTRWPHVLWKRKASELCTTEIVPGGFTQGQVSEEHFEALEQARAPAVVLDSEALHRGAVTPSPSSSEASGWKSTLSLELCTPSGFAAWEDFSTAGTTKDPDSPLDWRMLPFSSMDAEARRTPAASSFKSPRELPPAPWEQPAGKAKLRQEQRAWELAG